MTCVAKRQTTTGVGATCDAEATPDPAHLLRASEALELRVWRHSVDLSGSERSDGAGRQVRRQQPARDRQERAVEARAVSQSSRDGRKQQRLTPMFPVMYLTTGTTDGH